MDAVDHMHEMMSQERYLDHTTADKMTEFIMGI